MVSLLECFSELFFLDLCFKEAYDHRALAALDIAVLGGRSQGDPVTLDVLQGLVLALAA